MQEKREKSGQKNYDVNRRAIIVSLVLSAVILGLLLYGIPLLTTNIEFPFRAAIVDQLGMRSAISNFDRKSAADLLEDAGFNVSYHRSETVDVDFYKGLIQHSYGIIILRSHSATREGEAVVDFFTSEEFNPAKYRNEQENGWLTKGYYTWEPEKSYFAITPKFVENLRGSFPKSIIVAMGCNSLNRTCTGMAEAFIKKGATAYIGWNGLVQLPHTDNETIKFLKMFLLDEKTLREAVDAVETDPIYMSRMEYFPSKTGNLTISSLTSKTKDSTKSGVASTLSDPISDLRICQLDLKRKRS